MSEQAEVFPASTATRTAGRPLEGLSSERAGLATSKAAAAPAKPRRFALNLATNVGRLGLTIIVGAWYVPFLVRKLGPAAYGLVPLASSITAYMALITFGLEAALSRSLSISLERRDHGAANAAFNAALWGNVAIVVLLAMPATLAIINIEHIVRIPPGYEAATRWLFIGTVAAFLLNQVRIPFASPCFCLNRLDLQNALTVVETLVRVGLVALGFLVLAPRIEFVGAGIFAGTLISTLGAVRIWKKLTPDLRVRLADFRWSTLRDMYGTGGWVIVTQIGVMLYVNIDLLVANRLFGPGEGGRYAAVLQLPTLLKTLGMTVGEIFAPTMYQMYAQGNMAQMAAYLNNAIKFLGFVLALVVGLTCGFSEPLLRLWLGPAFANLAPLLALMVCHLCINLSMYPLYAVPLAANRVKVPGLVTLGVGLLNLLLALFLAKVAGWGLYGIAAAGAISLTIRHLLFTPIYGAVVLGQSFGIFHRTLPTILAATAATFGLCRLVGRWLMISNWADLAGASTLVCATYLGAIWLLLKPTERLALRNMVLRWRR